MKHTCKRSHLPAMRHWPVLSRKQAVILFQMMVILAVAILLFGCGGRGDSMPDQFYEDAAWEPSVTYLPVMAINTTDGAPVNSKKEYIPGAYSIKNISGETVHEGDLEIKGRGNATWDYPKKPYHIKLADGAKLLGMPKGKHWVLLANHVDKTMIRNELTFELSRRLSIAYTPRSFFIELYLNGHYRGVYQLTEHVRIDKDRVNIPELRISDTSDDLISGGYLIEIDKRRGEDFCIDSEKTSMVFCLKNPETLLETGWESQRQYVVTYIRQTDNAIFSTQFKNPDTGYAAYIDVDTTILYYLINELFYNPDGNLRYSAFLYKKRGDKFYFGPVWDFDIAVGNYWTDTAGWYIRDADWFERLFEDPAFEQKVKDRWAQIKAAGTLDALLAYIDDRALYLKNVQENNFKKWPILSLQTTPRRNLPGSYQGEVNLMKEWLQNRYAWMDARLSE